MSRSKTQKITDKAVFGPEPEFNGETLTQTEVVRALNWYNYMSSYEQASKWLSEYAGRPLGYSFDHKTYGFIARIIMRGADIPDYKKRLDTYLENLNEDDIEEKKERANNRIYYVMDFRARLDDILDNDLDIDIFKVCSEENIPTYIVNQNIEYLERLLDEVDCALEGTEKDVQEAYSVWGRVALKKYRKRISELLSGLQAYTNTKKGQRKPRKRKRNPEKILSKLKFMKIHEETGVRSINPEKLIGAKEVWLIDTKYGNLIWIEAMNEEGIEVRGTTLYNCKAKSKKCGRRLNEVLRDVSSGGKRSIRKLFKSLKTKEKECPTRCNDWTIIGKAFK